MWVGGVGGAVQLSTTPSISVIGLGTGSYFQSRRKKKRGWYLLLVDQTHCGPSIQLRASLKPPARENYFVTSLGQGFDQRSIESKCRRLSITGMCVLQHKCVFFVCVCVCTYI